MKLKKLRRCVKCYLADKTQIIMLGTGHALILVVYVNFVWQPTMLENLLTRQIVSLMYH